MVLVSDATVCVAFIAQQTKAKLWGKRGKCNELRIFKYFYNKTTHAYKKLPEKKAADEWAGQLFRGVKWQSEEEPIPSGADDDDEPSVSLLFIAHKCHTKTGPTAGHAGRSTSRQ